MVVLEWISTFVLAVVATMAVNYALFRHRRAGWLIALAFALYFFAAVFDLKPEHLPSILPPLLFLLASLAMLWAVVTMILERPSAAKPADQSPGATTGPPPSGSTNTKDR